VIRSRRSIGRYCSYNLAHPICILFRISLSGISVGRLMVSRYQRDEQEGEQIADGSRFQIDPSKTPRLQARVV
jgi:hypothetical protein